MAAGRRAPRDRPVGARHRRADRVERHDPSRRCRAGARRPRRRCSAGSCSRSRSARCSSPTRSASSSSLDFQVSSDSYGSIYYLMTGFHGLHVLAGLLLIVVALAIATGAGTARAAGAGRRVGQLLLALRRRRVDPPVPDVLRDPVTSGRHVRRLAVLLAVCCRRRRARGDGRRPAPAGATAPQAAADDRRPGRARSRALPHRLRVVPRRGRRRHRRRARLASAWAPPPPTSSSRPGACRNTDPTAQSVTQASGRTRRTRSTTSSRTSRRSATGRRSPTSTPARRSAAKAATLYLGNCAACHSAAGNGGALSYGRRRARRSRRDAASRSPRRCAPVPGQMPVFGPETFTRPAGELDRPLRRVPHDPEDPAASRWAASARSPRAWSRSSSAWSR